MEDPFHTNQAVAKEGGNAELLRQAGKAPELGSQDLVVHPLRPDLIRGQRLMLWLLAPPKPPRTEVQSFPRGRL